MKTKILIPMLLMLVLAGCKKSKSDPEPETPVASTSVNIVNQWTWKEFDDNEDGVFSPASPGNESLSLNSDGFFTAQFSYYKIGDVGAGNDDSGTYQYSGDTVIISSTTGKTIRAKVKKLTSTELWFIWQRYTSSKVEVHFTR